MGAHALAAHGHVRATSEINIFVAADPENAHRVIEALTSFGFSDAHLSLPDLIIPNVVLRLGRRPQQVGIFTSVLGLTFDEAWDSRIVALMDALEVNVIGREHLITSKRAAGRLQDLADIEALGESV